MTPPKIVVEALIAWLKETPTATLQDHALAHDDMAAHIMAAYQQWIPLIRYIVGRSVVADVAAMGEPEFQQILDTALRRVPDKGMVCYVHRAWFMDQCRGLQTALLQHYGSREATP